MGHVFSQQEKILYYSAHEKITATRLKAGDETIYEHRDKIDDIHDRIQQHNVHAYVSDEASYPYPFHSIRSKPYIVYMLGNTDVLTMPLLGIVGPRNISSYAQQVMQDIFTYIPQYHLATISGGAAGVDKTCHTLSLSHAIPTVVVLGMGLRYAMSTRARGFLQGVIDAGGLVLSEFRLDQSSTPYTFPQRNRIIAGLSDVLFVPAAGEKSGSLITVDFALQMHTHVYTVPASIYEVTSRGSNLYLAQGKMQALVDANSMLQQYFTPTMPGTLFEKKTLDLNEQQRMILDVLVEHGGVAKDMLVAHTSLAYDTILVQLTLLEMEGLIYEQDPGIYVAT